jgi:hypothetical protein
MLYRVHLAISGIELTMLVVMGTGCTGSCKSTYHMIATTATPFIDWYSVYIPNEMYSEFDRHNTVIVFISKFYFS